MVFGPIQERIYADKGHALDLSNKAFELLEFIGWEYATEVLPLIVEHLTQSRSKNGNMAGASRSRCAHSLSRGCAPQEPAKDGRKDRVKPDFYTQILGEDPQAILEPLLKQCITVFRRSKSHDIWHSRLRGAWRVSRSNDLEDWFAPMHTFSFCNALHRVLARGEAGRNWSADSFMQPCRST